MITILHIRTTKHLLAEFGFSQAAQRLAGQSVAWPDAIRYFDDRYHAQTSLQANGQPQPPAVAALNFSRLLRQLIEKVRTGGNETEQVAWLGCCLHLVQDLAVHQGNTGAEHFWQLFWLWKFPDIAPADIRRANEYSRIFLSVLRTKFGESSWNDLANAPVPILKSTALRQSLLGKSDFSWRLFFRFVRSVWHYFGWPRKSKRIRWDIKAVLLGALE